jgi:hypothetical protein
MAVNRVGRLVSRSLYVIIRAAPGLAPPAGIEGASR